MTKTPRFLKPKKLGLSGESWLKHEVLGALCTANVCLYFLGIGVVKDDAAILDESSVDTEPVGIAVGTEWLVDAAVSISDDIFPAIRS